VIGPKLPKERHQLGCRLPLETGPVNRKGTGEKKTGRRSHTPDGEMKKEGSHGKVNPVMAHRAPKGNWLKEEHGKINGVQKRGGKGGHNPRGVQTEG